MDDEFKAGQLVIYKMGDDCEIGKIKRICDDGESAFVWYHSGETSAKTKLSDLSPIKNSKYIMETILGKAN
jgi:hypothetical protein